MLSSLSRSHAIHIFDTLEEVLFRDSLVDRLRLFLWLQGLQDLSLLLLHSGKTLCQETSCSREGLDGSVDFILRLCSGRGTFTWYYDYIIISHFRPPSRVCQVLPPAASFGDS